MARIEIVGCGAWSQSFSDWQAFCDGLASDQWANETTLQPKRIPPRERRRAPQVVKMAIEVMDQACTMANIRAHDTAVVFSSAMGDMQITDYMCRALLETPRLISPTRFHNSVHNAAPGFWSIMTGAFTAANAISAHSETAPMALLEAAIQTIEENTPVIVVTQELAAPLPLMETCPSEQAFSAALLMTPVGYSDAAICSLDFSVEQRSAKRPDFDVALAENFDDNFGARLLPLLRAIANADTTPVDLAFPISASSCLALVVETLQADHV